MLEKENCACQEKLFHTHIQHYLSFILYSSADLLSHLHPPPLPNLQVEPGLAVAQFHLGNFQSLALHQVPIGNALGQHRGFGHVDLEI
jgi:hypothetical protein